MYWCLMDLPEFPTFKNGYKIPETNRMTIRKKLSVSPDKLLITTSEKPPVTSNERLLSNKTVSSAFTASAHKRLFYASLFGIHIIYT